jgi:LytS/YehU family sensor histidine kinase
MRPRLKFALLLTVYGIAIGLLEFVYKYLDYVTRGSHPLWTISFIEETTAGLAAVVAVPIAIWMARHYRLDTSDPRILLRNVPLHLVALGIGSFLHTSLNWGSRAVIFPLAGLGAYDYGAMPVRYFMELPSDTIGYAMTVGLATLYYRQVRAAQLEKTLAQAQLQNLRLQLNPHFLFNTLNTISSVMYEDVRIADRMIARLSDLLRSTLEQSAAQEVTLEREIEFLRLYVETMKARFEERLEVDVETTAETLGAMVPPLVLQPLVENSIKHGADGQTLKVRILVRAARDNGSLLLEVRDHGSGISGTTSAALNSGIGLSNTAERLERLYGGTHRLGLHNAVDGGLVVTVQVPFHVDPSPAG